MYKCVNSLNVVQVSEGIDFSDRNARIVVSFVVRLIVSKYYVLVSFVFIGHWF